MTAKGTHMKRICILNPSGEILRLTFAPIRLTVVFSAIVTVLQAKDLNAIYLANLPPGHTIVTTDA